jgi:hypothetical protein
MPVAVAIWVWFCAYLNGAGWALSAVRELNTVGYTVALAIGLAALAFWKRNTSAHLFSRADGKKLLRRFRRLFPWMFLILAAMAFLGGAIHAPNNGDALSYRIPRILHWLADGQWHWIHTMDRRLNDRSVGIEWVSTPFIVFFKTDRFLFLLNIISFLLLPGLVFSVFTRLGVRPRVAWHWMWIVPTGYCFVLQAGSIGNDLFGAPFALAAVDFALRAKISKSLGEAFTAILAAAMMTSTKTSSVPLLLPCAIALLPSLRLLWRRPLATVAVLILGVGASALPTMVFNQMFYGDFSGAGLKPSVSDMAVRTAANVFIIPMQNLVPPVFPMAEAWHREIEKIIPPSLNARLHHAMTEKGAAEFEIHELQHEQFSGLGFGVSLLLLVSFFAAAALDSAPSTPPAESRWRWLLRWSPAIALLALMTQYGLNAFSRILTPYYALLMPIVLARGGQERLVQKRWWRVAAFAVFLSASGLLVISPEEPLFPVMTILKHWPQAPARVRTVYTTTSRLHDAFAPAREVLPPRLKVLGLVIGLNLPETSLWRPFGSRRVVDVCPDDTTADLKARGVQYVLVNEDILKLCFHCSLDDWLRKKDARIVEKISMNQRILGPEEWVLVKLN